MSREPADLEPGVTNEWIILAITDHWQGLVIDADAGFFTSEMITSPFAADCGIQYPQNLEPGVYLMKNLNLETTKVMYALDGDAGLTTITGEFCLLCTETAWKFAAGRDFNILPVVASTLQPPETKR